MYVEEIQHPETGELHTVTAETTAELEQAIADLLADVVDLAAPPPARELNRTGGTA